MIGIGAAILPTTTKGGGGGKGAVDTVKISVSSPTGTVSQPEPSTCQVIDGLALVSVKLNAQQGQQNAVKQITTPTGVLKPDQVSGNLNMDAASLSAYTKAQTDAVISPVAQQASQAKDAANQANITANQAVATANQTKADLLVLVGDVDDIVYNLNNMTGQIISDNISGTLMFDYTNLQIILTENVVPSKLTMFVKSVAGSLPDLNGDAKPTPEQLDTYSQETIDSDFDSQQRQITQQGQQLQALIVRFDTQTGEITSPDGTVVGAMTWDKVNAKWTLSLRADRGGASTVIDSDNLQVSLIDGGYKINLGINPDQFNFVQKVLNFIGTTGSQYLFTDGLQESEPDPETHIVTVSTKADATQFMYDENGATILTEKVQQDLAKGASSVQSVNDETPGANGNVNIDAGGITPQEAEAIAQANFDTNVIPVNKKINYIDNNIEALFDYTGIEIATLYGFSFGTLDNQTIFDEIYTKIPVSGSTILVKLTYNNEISFIQIPVTKIIFLEFINLYNFASYIQEFCRAYKDINDINITPIFVCYWSDDLKAFIMSTNQVNTPIVVANTNIMGTAMKIDSGSGAKIRENLISNPDNLQEQIYAIKQSLEAIDVELTYNDTINKANSATQELSSSDNSVDITYTGRNANLKTKGGSMSTLTGYKQYQWNNLGEIGSYEIKTISDNIIPLSSITDVSLKGVQYSDSLKFSVTGLEKSAYIGQDQYWVLIGAIYRESTKKYFSYYTGATARSFADIQSAIATDNFIWIYWHDAGLMQRYQVPLIEGVDDISYLTLTTKIENTIKNLNNKMSTFKCQYDANINKFVFSIQEALITFTTDGIAQGGYDTNLACGVCVQSQSADVMVINSTGVATDGISNITDNQIWVSPKFLKTNLDFLSSVEVITDYVTFTADFSNFVKQDICADLRKNNNILIEFKSNDFTELSNTEFYPNRNTQNFSGTPYNPSRGVNSNILANANLYTISPIMTNVYNYWDYQATADNKVIVTIDLSRFPQTKQIWNQSFNFQYISPIKPTLHYVQLKIIATNTDYVINGDLKEYTSPLIAVKDTVKQKDDQNLMVEVSNKIFNLMCNSNNISVAEPNSDVVTAGGLEIWDITKAYNVDDIVKYERGLDQGVFICSVANIGNDPWLTNLWLPYGGINNYHLTDTTYQATTGINLVMVEAQDNKDVVIELPSIASVRDTWSCTFKACKLTDGYKITINSYHDAQGNHDLFENGQDFIELIDASDIITIYIRSGDNKIYYTIGG